jgi:hypothetical protein
VDNFISTLQTIYFKDENTIFVGGHGGVLLKSTDAGLTWTRLYTSIKADFVAINFSDEMNGIAVSAYNGGNSSTFHSTDDGGNTWMPVFYFESEARNICVMDNNDIYMAGTEGCVLRYSAGQSPSATGYITGENVVCVDTKSEYQAIALHYGEYKWEITPIQSIQFAGNKATVTWSQPGIYTIKATQLNSCGEGLPQVFEVLVLDMESASIAGDNIVLQHEANVTYISDAGSGIRVNWQVLGDENLALVNEREINVTWGLPPTGEINLVHTSAASGCRQSASLTVYIFGPDNISDELQKMQVQIYPNPTTAKLNIRPTAAVNNLTLYLYNEKGELLVTKATNGNTVSEIDMESLSSGVYILKITGNTMSTSVKVIKQ